MGLFDSKKFDLQSAVDKIQEKIADISQATESANVQTVSAPHDNVGKVMFCSNCGTKLNSDAKFCHGCGATMEKIKTEAPKREIVYEGKLHKCPNCGEVLESFISHCPSCGYEIRDTHSASSVREFAEKLARIEARQMPAFEEKKSAMKMIFGKDLENKDEAEKARKDFKEQFEKQKEQEKATFIINYSVPNTKEDILEFMILAATNINVKKGVDDVVTKAWIRKLEQVYHRAEISIGKSSDFSVIKDIYDQKKAELKSRKFKGLSIASLIVGGFALLIGIISFTLEKYAVGVIWTLVGIALVIAFFKFISIYISIHNKNKKESL